MGIGMQHSGIGGGGFMLVRGSDGKYESIGMPPQNPGNEHHSDSLKDFRETAPAAAFEDMYQGNIEGSVRTGLASGVPGDVRGLEYLHNKYGVKSSSQIKSCTHSYCKETSMESSMQSSGSCGQVRVPCDTRLGAIHEGRNFGWQHVLD
jgi:gamma-glutamyltranspeptidase/glutathione hydrolase